MNGLLRLICMGACLGAAFVLVLYVGVQQSTADLVNSNLQRMFAVNKKDPEQ